MPPSSFWRGRRTSLSSQRLCFINKLCSQNALYFQPHRTCVIALSHDIDLDDESSSWEADSVSFDPVSDEHSGEADTVPTTSGAGSDSLINEYDAWSEAVNKTFGALKKKRGSLQKELDKVEKMEGTIARAQLLTSNLYMFTPGVSTAIVQDWENGGKEIELALDPAYDSASAEADALFQQARKLKRGSQIISDLLKEVSEALNSIHELQMDLESALSEDHAHVDEDRLRWVQDRLLRTSKAINFHPPSDKDLTGKSTAKKRQSRKPELGTPASNIRKLKSPAGCAILVGRNRRGNEYLTFNIARGPDVWMHARGSPGAHVLIVQRRGGGLQATDECFQLAANLAAFYSDARSERKAAVTVAEPKHLLKPRGAPLGAVKLREELEVWTGYPEGVPENLKEAREASGLSVEYRAANKAQFRKRNKLKQKQAKQRAKGKQHKKG